MRSSRIGRVGGFGSKACRLYRGCRFGEVCDLIRVDQLMLACGDVYLWVVKEESKRLTQRYRWLSDPG